MRPSPVAALVLIVGVSMVAACQSAASAQPPQTGGGRPPYRIGAMTIPSGATSLAATVTTPEGPGPFPALIVAGATDEAATIADGLTRRGIVVLRADVRSAEGITAMVTQVKTIPSVDPARIGVLGIGSGARAFLSGLTVPVYAGNGDVPAEKIMEPLAAWVLSLK